MLCYQSFFPSQRLSRHIARYLIISDSRKYRDWQRMEITPTGLSGLGFSLADNFRYQTPKGNEQEIFGGNIVGLHNCCYSINWKYPIDFFVVIFKFVGASRLLKTNMNELRNNWLTSMGLDWRNRNGYVKAFAAAPATGIRSLLWKAGLSVSLPKIDLHRVLQQIWQASSWKEMAR